LRRWSVIAIAIQTQNLAKIYTTDSEGRPLGLVDLTLAVESGQIFGLVGPNGSGKTTTLKLLLGLVFPTSGSGEVLGLPLGDPACKEQLGFVPEGPYFYDYLNATELLHFYGSLYRMGGSQLNKRIQEVLELVGMWERRVLKVVNYSRGMLQRIGLAQALLHDPELILMDEPTAGLDPIGAAQIRKVIIRLREEGKTIFLCSHLLKEMEPLCDTVAILNEGMVCRQGRMKELLAGEDGQYMVRVRGLSEELKGAVASAVSVQPEGEEHLVVFADDKAALAGADRLVNGGATVLHVGPQRRSLEEVFIDAVGGEI